MQETDALETQSKLSAISVGSSKSRHSKASGRRSRHKKPNRRRSRHQINNEKSKEPLYNNVMMHADENYMGDDDHFDTLERQRRTLPLPEELPSVIHEDSEGLQEEEFDLEDGDGGREQPASLEDLPGSSQLTSLSDLPKRETSV